MHAVGRPCECRVPPLHCVWVRWVGAGEAQLLVQVVPQGLWVVGEVEVWVEREQAVKVP